MSTLYLEKRKSQQADWWRVQFVSCSLKPPLTFSVWSLFDIDHQINLLTFQTFIVPLTFEFLIFWIDKDKDEFELE